MKDEDLQKLLEDFHIGEWIGTPQNVTFSPIPKCPYCKGTQIIYILHNDPNFDKKREYDTTLICENCNRLFPTCLII